MQYFPRGFFGPDSQPSSVFSQHCGGQVLIGIAGNGQHWDSSRHGRIQSAAATMGYYYRSLRRRFNEGQQSGGIDAVFDRGHETSGGREHHRDGQLRQCGQQFW